MERKTNWLKTLREQNRITQDDLTARLQTEGFDVSRSTIAGWELGKQPPLNDPVFRQALSRALRVNIRTILKLAGYEVEQENHSIWAEQAASLIDQLPPEKQELALRLVEQLARG